MNDSTIRPPFTPSQRAIEAVAETPDRAGASTQAWSASVEPEAEVPGYLQVMAPAAATAFAATDPALWVEAENRVVLAHVAGGMRARMAELTSSGSITASFNKKLESATTAEADRMLSASGPVELAAFLESPGVSPKAKARIVEVCLVRGGRESRADLERLAQMTHLPGATGAVMRHDRSAEVRKLEYQHVAEAAVFENPDGGKVFAELSLLKTRVDAERPASRFMAVMAQPGGWHDPERLAGMMLAMPPQVRGQMYFHLHDAANNSEKGTTRVTGGTVGAEAHLGQRQIGELTGTVGLEIEYTPRDSEWQLIVEDVAGYIIDDVKTEHREENCAFNSGLELANRQSTNSTRECP